MMSFSNFHTHCYFCDGTDDPEEYVKKAIEFKFSDLGFSSHAPLPFPNSWTMGKNNFYEYCNKINSLKLKYKNEINIYLGLEVDYIENLISPTDEKFASLDYTIGSVHMLKDIKTGEFLAVDGDEDEYIKLITSAFDNDVKKFVHAYYTQIRNMVSNKTPSIVGHLDLIKKHNKNNKYFNENEPWYKDEILNTLKVISENKTILELNTGGKVRGYTDDFYPSNWILTECRHLDIPIILNSDAHNPQYINAYFSDATILLKNSNYLKQRILHNEVWQDVLL
ncbi:histidinol-phosphatase (PHP family) [Clostridium acidisoli DSM 12555]|uniref:Histidinol-phosphatase n=2 Tax=Clostridium TaxID=1485 RepID=A0A1W1XWN0_9CLOT|nr:histidinol-phosphatase (PHP family) [Clostridium acidisoli DSM 12555]